mgnify:FL=1
MKDINQLKELLRNSKNSIDFYSELYSDVDIDSIEDYDDFRKSVPEISKDRMLEFYEDGSFNLGSEEIENGILARPTSGTTSDMAIYYRLKEEIDSHCQRFSEATDHFFEGGKNKDRVLVATTFSLLPILSQQFMHKGCMVTSGSPFDIERTAETFKAMKCNTLVSSPPVALKMSEKLKEKGYEGLEKYYLVSSGLSSLTRARFDEMYPDAEIMLQYGLAETGILMHKCEHLKADNKYHLFDDDKPFYYEFITEEGKEAEPGEIGEIVVTKFNEKTPLIRYNVGDLFEVRGKCECGERLYKFIGRKEDKFKIQGVTVFRDRIEEALEPSEDYVKQFQVIIDEAENEEMPKPKIILKLELTEDNEKVRESIAESFSENFEVADDYSWKKGVEMDLFAPVEVESNVFEERKFREIKDERYD